MKRQVKVILTSLLVGSMVLGLASCGGAKKSESDKGFTLSNEIEGKEYEITYDKVPERAVSVAGFTTEMMLSLGLEDKMVGYSYQDNEVPEEYADAIAKVKNLAKENPSQEVLLNEKPDFLTGWVTAFNDKTFPPQFCEDNGIKIYVPRVEYPNATMDTVYEDYKNLGKIFGVEDKAEKQVSKMKKEIAEVEEKVKDEKPVKVFIYDSGEKEPFTASAGLPTDMIKKAGGENVFAGEKDNWLNVSWEKVVEANPDQIIITKYNVSDDANAKKEFLMNNPALKDVKAIKDGNVFIMGLSEIIGGPRNPGGIKTMAEHFHPEAFK